MITPDVIAVVAHRDYRIVVTFADQRSVNFDMQPYLKYPFFKPLGEPSRFLAVRIVDGTVARPGDIDMSPDTIYMADDPA